MIPPISASAGGGGPSNALGTSSFDSSGWNINFGGGAIDSARNDATAGNLSQYLPFVAIGAAVLIAWKLSKRRK